VSLLIPPSLRLSIFMNITTDVLENHRMVSVKFDVWRILTKSVNSSHLRLKPCINSDSSYAEIRELQHSCPPQLSHYIGMYLYISRPRKRGSAALTTRRPSIHKKLALHFIDKWRSLSRYSSLADWRPRSLFVCFLYLYIYELLQEPGYFARVGEKREAYRLLVESQKERDH
jgi:hypothetical protein